MKSVKWIYGWLSLSLILLMASCSKDNTPTATLQVHLTDSPGDYQEVNIDIKDVQVSNSDPNSNSGWVSLGVQERIYNLLDLTNGLDTLLASALVPPGKITQIRLVLGSNNTVKIADQTFNLSTPSAQQSGLKVLINTTVSAGVTYKVTLDFDAARSIVVTGNSKYILKPVIRPIVVAQIGSIKGTVTPAAATPAVYAIQGADTVETTGIDKEGGFLLQGLPVGSYTVSFAPKTGFSPYTIPNSVAVTVGNTTDVGTVTISPQ